MAELLTSTAWVYALEDPDGNLCYAGSTRSHPPRRLVSHQKGCGSAGDSALHLSTGSLSSVDSEASFDGEVPGERWRATRDRTGPPAYGNGRPGDLRRLRNRPGFLNYRGEPAQSSAVTLARGTAIANFTESAHRFLQEPSNLTYE